MATTLTVGPGKTYADPQSAINAIPSSPSDVYIVDIYTGRYGFNPTSGWLTISKSTTSSNYIILRAHPGEHVVFYDTATAPVGRNNWSSYNMCVISSPYTRIEGIRWELTTNNISCVSSTVTDVVARNCEIEFLNSSQDRKLGFKWYGTNNKCIDCVIRQPEYTYTGDNGPLGIVTNANSGQQAIGCKVYGTWEYAIIAFTCNNITIQECEAIDINGSGGSGFFFHRPTSVTSTIKNCITIGQKVGIGDYDAGSKAPEIVNNFVDGLSKSGSYGLNYFASATANTIIKNNSIQNCDTAIRYPSSAVVDYNNIHNCNTNYSGPTPAGHDQYDDPKHYEVLDSWKTGAKLVAQCTEGSSPLPNSNGYEDNYSGAITGVGYTDGPFGNCLNFTATAGAGTPTQYVTFADNDYWDPGTGPLTISLWTKFTSNADMSIISLGGQTSGATPGFKLNVHPIGYIEFYILIPGGYKRARTSATSWNDGKWHHIISERNTEEDLMKIFVDGVEIPYAEQGDAAVGIDIVSTGLPMYIGRQFNGSQFNGQLCKVYMFNRMLSNEEKYILLMGH